MSYRERRCQPMTFGMAPASPLVSRTLRELDRKTSSTPDPSPVPVELAWPEARLLAEALTEQEHTTP